MFLFVVMNPVARASDSGSHLWETTTICERPIVPVKHPRIFGSPFKSLRHSQITRGMPSVLNRGKVSRVRIAHAVCEETLQYILDWEFIFSVCVILLLCLLLSYAKKEKDLLFYLTLLLINLLAALWVYWRCISRPSTQYLELYSNPQLHLCGGEYSSGPSYGGNRNSGKYEYELHTIQDILDTNTFQEAKPAFGNGRLRQSAVSVYSSEDSFRDGDDAATADIAADIAAARAAAAAVGGAAEEGEEKGGSSRGRSRSRA